ncbi:MAG: ABC transporter permease [Actinobacteria bacterium]|jgi:ABC-2 type transport system permease protein/oleandomycin transport system permease protein|nr:ABC transporter permease [Actinomycetota bacterium]
MVSDPREGVTESGEGTSALVPSYPRSHVHTPNPPWVKVLGQSAVDYLAIGKRNLLRYVRLPNLLATSTIQPIMFVLLFTYVFGGVMKLEVHVNYVDFLMPGIFVQAAVFGSTQTGIGLAQDLTTGMIDRFRSLPMARSAVLAGRTLSDVMRNIFVVLLMTGVGALLGFRFHEGGWAILAGLAIVVFFGLSFSWVSAVIGLLAGDVESAQAASFIWILPLTFASSAFVPVNSMPGWLQAFAKADPVTHTVDVLRGLIIGGPVAVQLWESIAWLVGIMIVAVPLAVILYRRAS